MVLPYTFHFAESVFFAHTNFKTPAIVIKFTPLLDTNFQKNINYIEEKKRY